MSIQRYQLELYNLNTNLEEVLKDIIKKNEGIIVGLVKNRLYQTGKDATGKEITPTYSQSTIDRKKEKRQRSSFVTLRDKGLFYDGFYLELDNYDLILSSSDSKTSLLIDKYGEAILQFTVQEQAFILNEIIDPGIEDMIKQINSNSSSAGGIELDIF